MKILRLICTYRCPKNCDGCCNKQDSFQEDKIDVFDGDFSKYDQVIITGGEPMLSVLGVGAIANDIKKANPDAKIILYTTSTHRSSIESVLTLVDGITITMHEQADVDDFNRLNFWLLRRKWWIRDNNKTLRLNVFKGVDVYMQDDSLWRIKDNIEWIMDCPLPVNEEIRKLKHMW